MLNNLLRYLDDKKILILGFGKEGVSTYKFIRKHFPDKKIYISDKKTTNEEIIKKDINVNIKAMSSDNAFHSLEDYDVLLIGPQMRFMRKKFLKAAEDKGLNLPIEAIDSVSYGRIDGEGVLKQALSLLEE